MLAQPLSSDAASAVWRLATRSEEEHQQTSQPKKTKKTWKMENGTMKKKQ